MNPDSKFSPIQRGAFNRFCHRYGYLLPPLAQPERTKPMFARPNSQHSHVAYVTKDIDAVIAVFRREFDTPGFYVFTKVGTGTGEGAPQRKIGLVGVGGMAIELIEPTRKPSARSQLIPPRPPDICTLSREIFRCIHPSN